MKNLLFVASLFLLFSFTGQAQTCYSCISEAQIGNDAFPGSGTVNFWLDNPNPGCEFENIQWDFAYVGGFSSDDAGDTGIYEYTESGTYNVCVTFNVIRNGIPCSTPAQRCNHVTIILPLDPIEEKDFPTDGGSNDGYIDNSDGLDKDDVDLSGYDLTGGLGNLGGFGTGKTSLDDITPIEPTISTYPNPCSNNINFNYQLNSSTAVSIVLYDAQGKIIDNIVQGQVQAAGEYSLPYNTADLAKGIYYYKLSTAEHQVSGKVIKLAHY